VALFHLCPAGVSMYPASFLRASVILPLIHHSCLQMDTVEN